MSFLWNILLSFDNEEWWVDGEDQPRDTCEPLEGINRWIAGGKLVDLTGPTYMEGAGYGLDANLFGGAFKHFDIEGFIKVVEAQTWKERAKVQLWVRGAEAGMCEEPFTAVRLARQKAVRPQPTSVRKRKSPAKSSTRASKR